jgi:hypothetical protein
MRTQWLASLAILCGAAALQAQQWPGYGGVPFPQGQPAHPMFINPYANHPYAPTAPPASAGPRVYYGDFPNAVPAASAPMPPRPSYIPAQHGPPPTSDGPVYYYADQPSAAPYNYYPQAQPGRWSPPPPEVRRPGGYPISVPESSPEPPPPRIKPTDVPFHRPTKDCWWISADYVASLMRPMRLAAPLVTTGSTATPTPGVLGQPGTAVLLDGTIDFGLFSGFRIGAGRFLDDCGRVSVEVIGTWQAENTRTYFNQSDAGGTPVIARPVFNVAANREGAFVNSVPGNVAGFINIDFRSQLYGAELNGRYHVYWWERFHGDALFGFRYQNLRETMRFNERLTPLIDNFLTFRGASVNAPNQLGDGDVFGTSNQFYGAQIGARLSYEYEWLTVGWFAKLALGGTVQRSNIEGSTTMFSPDGNNQVAAGSVLAQPSNIGQRSRTVFGLLPEFGLNAGFDLTKCTRLNLGYSFLFWNHVIRPGSQIDRLVNPNQAPSSVSFGATDGQTRPIYRFNDELFYSHNFHIGLEFHY